MNSQQLALYQKIQAFALDKPNVYFTYSQRLARDHLSIFGMNDIFLRMNATIRHNGCREINIANIAF